MNRLLVIAFVALLTLPANAVELRQTMVRTGTEGLVLVELNLANATSGPVSCIGQLAHWYSKEVAQIASGDSALIELWFDPETGTYALLNALDENMPVEALWCGVAGKAYETKGMIALDRSADVHIGPVSLSCSLDSGRLACK